jgi:hypothetical protein
VNGVILNSFIPIMIIALSWAFLRERLGTLQVTGIGVSLAGVLTILSGGSLATLAAFRLNGGDLLIILSMAMASWCVTGQSATPPSDILVTQEPITALLAAQAPSPQAALGDQLFYDVRLSRDQNKSCNTCHKLKPPQPPADFDAKLALRMGVADKPMLDLWSRRISAGTFRHEWFSHAELSCSTCHNVNTINTADHLTTKVPVTACAACHATATADEGGVLNYEVESRNKNKSFQCTKCHIVFGSKPIPESHLKALRAATGKQ